MNSMKRSHILISNRAIFFYHLGYVSFEVESETILALLLALFHLSMKPYPVECSKRSLHDYTNIRCKLLHKKEVKYVGTAQTCSPKFQSLLDLKFQNLKTLKDCSPKFQKETQWPIAEKNCAPHALSCLWYLPHTNLFSCCSVIIKALLPTRVHEH